VLGWLGNTSALCLGPSLSVKPNALRARAARLEPTSALFRYFQGPSGTRHGIVNDIAAEIHRRFDRRGEHYRIVRDQLRAQLVTH